MYLERFVLAVDMGMPSQARVSTLAKPHQSGVGWLLRCLASCNPGPTNMPGCGRLVLGQPPARPDPWIYNPTEGQEAQFIAWQ
jgi:hypothetical protein